MNVDNIFVHILPNEIILKILLELSVPNILSLCQVSKALLDFTQNDALLWKPLLLRDFNLNHKEEETWREEYEYQVRKSADQILVEAAKSGNLLMVKYTLYYKTTNYISAMAEAAQNENHLIIDFLLEITRENDISIDYDSIIIPLIETGKIHMIKIILNKIEEHIQDHDYKYLLYSAATYGNLEIFELLIMRAAPHTIKCYYTVIFQNSIEGGNLTLIEILLLVEPDSGWSEWRENHLLQLAARSGNQQVINLIANKIFGLSISLDDPLEKLSGLNYETMLLGAIQGGHTELVSKILDYITENNIAIDWFEVRYQTGSIGNEEIIRLFLQEEDHLLIHVLHGAVRAKYSEIVKIVLNLINERNIYPSYDHALNVAIDNGDPIVTKLLLDQIKKESLEPDYSQTLEELGKDIDINVGSALLDDIARRNLSDDFEEFIKIMIYLAAKHGHLEVFQKAVKMIHSLYINYNQILTNAVLGRNFEIIKYSFDHKGNFILNYNIIIKNAVKSGSKKLVNYLLQKAENDGYFMNYYSLLFVAIRSGYLHLVRLIIIKIRENANFKRLPKFDDSMIEMILSHSDILEHLLKEPDFQPDYDYYVLKAAIYGKVSSLKILLRKIKHNNIKLLEKTYKDAIQVAMIKNLRSTTLLLENIY